MRILIKSVRPEVINGVCRMVLTKDDGTELISKKSFSSYRTCIETAERLQDFGMTSSGTWEPMPTSPAEFKTREAAELALNDPETQKVYPTWRTVYMVATREEYEAHIMENVERAIEPKGVEK